MTCQRCNSDRVGSVYLSAQSYATEWESWLVIKDKGVTDFIPNDVGITEPDEKEFGGTCINFKWCLNCGQIQGHWPLEKSNLEKQED